MPNFRGVRFTNAHETLIWASKKKEAKYTFNYQTMKTANDDLQMRSDWTMPICTGTERIKIDGKKAHSTQKPLALLYRILLASTKPGDIVLDPFFGTGTTGVCAVRLHRHWIGIEKESKYIKIAQQRIAGVESHPFDEQVFRVKSGANKHPRIPFISLLEQGLLTSGQKLYFKANRDQYAVVKSDGHLIHENLEGSIHFVGRQLLNNIPCNGWEVWFYEDTNKSLHPIDLLRREIRQKSNATQT